LIPYPPPPISKRAKGLGGEKSRCMRQWRDHEGGVGWLGGLKIEPPTVLRGHSRYLRRTDKKISPRNVVPANTLVIVVHLVTFSESQ